MATANYTEQQTKEMVAKYEAAPTRRYSSCDSRTVW